MTGSASVGVLFVCLGNICRSPTAHGVFETLLEQGGWSDFVEVDSCGMGDWHVGGAPDGRATKEAQERGYDLSGQRARQVHREDFLRFDYILAMDKSNLAELRALCPHSYAGHLGLFLEFAEETDHVEVPDPYYGGADGFTQVLDLVELASRGLLREICDAHFAQ